MLARTLSTLSLCAVLTTATAPALAGYPAEAPLPTNPLHAQAAPAPSAAATLIAVGPGDRVERRQDHHENRQDVRSDRHENRGDKRDCVGDGRDCHHEVRQDSRDDRHERKQDQRDDRQERRF